ncbi:MAG TPA: hypothetical protein VFO31_06140 [Vicinamibacterales bacterium]|nr:hypothetical protein [Vicinamibacterales bacterium]
MPRAAVTALVVAMVASAAGVLLPRGWFGRIAGALWMPLAFAVVIYGAHAVLTGPPAFERVDLPTAWRVSSALTIALAITSLTRRPLLGRVHVPLLLTAFVVTGVWLLVRAPAPAIDVIEFQHEGYRALLAGSSPYSTTIPNLYEGREKDFYGPNLVADGRVQVGYPYPAVNLLLAWPAHLAGDYRYALVVAIALAAGLIAYTHDGRGARLGAAMLLTWPTAFYVCLMGWTDPFVAAALAGVIFCAVRARGALPYVLGLFLATKQYAVLALPIVVWLYRPSADAWAQARRAITTAVIVAAAIILPFAVFDPKGFIDSVVLFQLRQPFRGDALSVLVKIPDGRDLGSTLCLIGTLAALGACVWRSPRGAAGFAGSLAFIFVMFFGFAKQAFWNYYLVAFTAMACAIGAFGARSEKLGSPLMKT